MKRIMVLVAVFAVIAAGSTAFAIYQGKDSVDRGLISPSLSPVSEVRAADPEPAGTASSGRRCGSSSRGCSSGGSGGNCCGGSGTAAGSPQVDQIKAYLSDYYRKILGPETTVEVKDLGCHQEAEIRQGNRVLKRLSISGGTVTDIT